MYTIYKLTNSVNGKCYIGQTKNFSSRMSDHKSARTEHLISKAVRKHGWDAFQVEALLENVPEHDADYWECRFIKEHKSMAPDGYNLESGGNKHKTLSAETRRKISENQIGRVSPRKGVKLTAETKAKLSKAKIGKPSPRKGAKLSEETKEKLRVANLGKKHSRETKFKQSDSMVRKLAEKRGQMLMDLERL